MFNTEALMRILVSGYIFCTLFTISSLACMVTDVEYNSKNIIACVGISGLLTFVILLVAIGV